MSRILIVEDDPLISAFLSKGLRSSGYVTHVVEDGEEALGWALTGEFDLVILDMALPERDGFQVLTEIRTRRSEIPVIVLTGRPELRDAAMCFDVGADDYMTKPFRFDELEARVRARLRGRLPSETSVVVAGEITLNLLTRRAARAGCEISLSNREFELLAVLMRHPDQVLTREQILSHVWGYYFDPGTNVLSVYIASLRRKLGTDVIETVRGAGYRFNVSRPLASPESDAVIPIEADALLDETVLAPFVFEPFAHGLKGNREGVQRTANGVGSPKLL